MNDPAAENNNKIDLDKPTRTMVSITPNEAEKLRNISPKGQVTDGIRIALKESAQYRRERLALEELRNNQDEY